MVEKISKKGNKAKKNDNKEICCLGSLRLTAPKGPITSGCLSSLSPFLEYFYQFLVTFDNLFLTRMKP